MKKRQQINKRDHSALALKKQKKQETTNFFQLLHHDVLNHIFSFLYLDEVAEFKMVCKFFYHSVNYYLQNLRCNNTNSFFVKGHWAFVKQFKNLQSLILDFNIPDPSQINLADYLKALESLQFLHELDLDDAVFNHPLDEAHAKIYWKMVERFPSKIPRILLGYTGRKYK